MITFLVLQLSIATKQNTLYGDASLSCCDFGEHLLLPLHLTFLFQPLVF